MLPEKRVDQKPGYNGDLGEGIISFRQRLVFEGVLRVLEYGEIIWVGI